MHIRVIFLQDVPDVAMAGDIKSVAGGYARNFLIPKGLAAPATREQLKRIEKLKRAGDEQRAEELQGLQALGSRLDNASITFPARAGEGGRLYGSITTLTIAEELSKLVGQEIERRTVLLPEPIKALGTYQVKVRLNSQVTPTVTVVVEEERARAAAEPPTAAQEAPKPAQASAEAGGQGEAGQPVAQQGTPPPGEPVSAAEEAATREGDVRGEATST